MQAANAPGLMANMTNADNRLVGFAGAQALQNSQGDAVVAQNSNNEGVAPAPMGGGGHGTAQGVQHAIPASALATPQQQGAPSSGQGVRAALLREMSDELMKAKLKWQREADTGTALAQFKGDVLGQNVVQAFRRKKSLLSIATRTSMARR